MSLVNFGLVYNFLLKASVFYSRFAITGKALVSY